MIKSVHTDDLLVSVADSPEIEIEGKFCPVNGVIADYDERTGVTTYKVWYQKGGKRDFLGFIRGLTEDYITVDDGDTVTLKFNS